MLKHLKRPLVVFDLETTGTDTQKDRTVQIAMLRIETNGKRRKFKSLVNPGRPIPAESTAVHGVTDADVADAPKLVHLADQINAWTRDADLAGHNGISFDLEILQRELYEFGVQLEGPEDQAFIDTLRLEQHLHPNTLEATYKRRTGKVLDGAHDAMIDVEATVEVLESQLKELGGKKSAGEIEVMLRGDHADRARKFKRSQGGDLIFAFGTHRGKTVREVHATAPDYLAWMEKNGFPTETMKQVRECLEHQKQAA